MEMSTKGQPSEASEYSEINDNRNIQQQNIYTKLDKPSKMNRMILLAFITTICTGIGVVAMAMAIYLLVNKLDLETRLNDLESKLKSLPNGISLKDT